MPAMRLLLLALALWLAPAPLLAAQAEAFDAGVAAYRSGDHAAASELWQEALAQPLPASERARVAYDLGNAAWRAGKRGEALGWYSAALRAAPRHADARRNLAFAREELGLPPADEGSLAAAFRRAAGALTRAEAAWAVIGASGLFLAELSAGGDPHIAIGVPSVALRAEPRTDLPSISVLEAGRTAERIDALGGWLRVETAAGERGWAPAEELFRLER